MSTTVDLPFETITPSLASGTAAPQGWRAIDTLPLVILVGVTGVGKSTLLAELSNTGAEYLLLPDRRELTDLLIIRAMQAADGVPPGPVTDRGQRFAYTRRYRERYAGGMAHALSQLWVKEDAPQLLIFDGLRGANEVAYAASAFPQARFVMLDAPDLIRLQRLLGRGDAFDQIQTAAPAQEDGSSFATLGVPEASAIFSPAEEATILGWLHSGAVTADQLRAKLQIVVEERRNYDPVSTLEALRTHAPDATLYVDTVTHAPSNVAALVIDWLELKDE
jgi:hypothetical protein